MLTKNTHNLNLGIPSKVLFDQSIVDVFVLQGILDLEDAEKLKKHFKTNREVENFLIKNRLVTRETINKAYSIILKLPFVELKNIEISSEALSVIPEKIARKYGIIPFDLNGKILKIAVTCPADLPLGFSSTLSKLFKNKKIIIELFITLSEDLRESLKQYGSKGKKSLLIKKGSLPVVYLRNRQIPRTYLNKMPKNFIEKYRLLVFDENISGDYMVACEKPDSPLTKKILNYIKKENKVTLEVFATSKDDIDYVLLNYDHNSSFQMESLHHDDGQPEKSEKSEQEKDDNRGGEIRPSIFSSLSDLLFKPDFPSLTVDSITSKASTYDAEDDKSNEIGFQNAQKKHIMIEEKTNQGAEKKSVSLIGKIDKDHLIKLPKEFIQKYRIVVFGENNSGELMLASDSINSELTEKAIEFIKKQHPIELFLTSKDDIEYAVNIY
ncbi:MAG: hypothetical protein M1324_00505 [Patescibacteria group bacterium]|nr:hypothetical protein [Patescibacteria group bacterium]